MYIKIILYTIGVPVLRNNSLDFAFYRSLFAQEFPGVLD